jgi:hypothetical protein
MQCTWCKDDNAEVNDGTLCPPHEAECLGVTVDWMERAEAGQYAEYLDSIG